MATSPLEIRFRILLEQVDETGAPVRADGMTLDGGIITVPIRVGDRPGAVMRNPSGGIPAGLVYRGGAAVGPEWPDTQANDQRPRGQATDPDYVPGIGTPADVRRRAEAGLRGPVPETGDEYAARLEREDRTPHVESGPGHVPTPRDLPRRARG